MTVVIITLVVVVLYIFVFGSKSSENKEDVGFEQQPESLIEKRVSPIANEPEDWLIKAYEEDKKKDTGLTAKEKKEKKEKRLKEKAKEIFCDAKPSVKDFSHLTEEEAERKLERLKERDGWVDDDVYIGLTKIINGDYPIMDVPESLIGAEPEEVYKWFKDEKEVNNNYFSNDVWKYICCVLKPYHETELLNELKSVDAAELEMWMNDRKAEGKFFSNKVYNKMRSKWLNYQGV